MWHIVLSQGSKTLEPSSRRTLTFLLFALFTAVDVIFKLYSHLSLRRLVPYEWMFQKLFCVRSLMVVLHQHRLDESVKLFGPFFRLEPRRWITRDQKQSLFDDKRRYRYMTVYNFMRKRSVHDILDYCTVETV